MSEIRSRHYEIILYPNEDKKHDEILEFIKKNYDHVYITHDKDVDEKGELKKPHVHVVVSFKNAKYLNGLATELDCAPNLIEVVTSLDNKLLYLIHFGIKDKSQYSTDLVQGNLKYKLLNLVAKNDEAEQVKKIIDLLYSLPKPVTYTQLLLACCENGLYSAFRRLGYGIKMLLDESKFVERS